MIGIIWKIIWKDVEVVRDKFFRFWFKVYYIEYFCVIV